MLPSAGVVSLSVSDTVTSAVTDVAVLVKVADGVFVSVRVLVTLGIRVDVGVGGSCVFVAGTGVADGGRLGGTEVLVCVGGTNVHEGVGSAVLGARVFVEVAVGLAVTGGLTTTNAAMESELLPLSNTLSVTTYVPALAKV